jgi:hypothetical protein
MRGPKRRHDTEGDAGEDARSGCECQHEPVGPQIEVEGIAFGREERQDSAAQGTREDSADERSAHGQQEIFDEELKHHASTRRSNGDTHRNLLLPSAGTSEQQIHEVHAGHEQHQSGHGQQDPECRSVSRPQLTHAVGGRHDGQPKAPVPFQSARITVRRKRCLQETWAERAHVLGGALDGPASIQPARGAQPEPVATIQWTPPCGGRTDWEGNVESLSDLQAEKLGRGHTQYRDGPIQHRERSTDDTRISAELRFPEGVVQHDNRRASTPIIIRTHQPTEGGCDTKLAKCLAADPQAADESGVWSRANEERCGTPGEDAGECLLV